MNFYDTAHAAAFTGVAGRVQPLLWFQPAGASNLFYTAFMSFYAAHARWYLPEIQSAFPATQASDALI